MKFLSSEVETGPNNSKIPVEVGGPEDQGSNLLSKSINKLLDVDHLIILAGSGTSLTFNKNPQNIIAPGMWDLWEKCRRADPVLFDKCLHAVNYDDLQDRREVNGNAKADIELLLSLCDSNLTIVKLSLTRRRQIEQFLNNAKQIILEATDFTSMVEEEDWKWHEKLVRTLARRSPKQQRLKLFTTNYDLAFEEASSRAGFTIIDGFDFTNPSTFNPMWYHYDIIVRAQAGQQATSFLPNVLQLYKLHGSVDWRKIDGRVVKNYQGRVGEPVFIYPSSSKYQNSYDSPYLEMISAFLSALQQPKTAVLCLGFGFNDKHLNNSISLALRTNPELMLMVGTRSLFSPGGSFNAQMRELLTGAINGGDSRIGLFDGTFAEFVDRIPSRYNQGPGDELLKAFEAVIAATRT